jgi:hypothetical protein
MCVTNQSFPCKYCMHACKLRIQWPYRASMYVCMYKGWATKLAIAPLSLIIYCASPSAAAMIITVAALRIVLAPGSKPT